MDMNTVDKVAIWVALVGAINWGLVGFMNYNLVTSFIPQYASIVYDVIGVAGAYAVYNMFK
jgi:hypothetical protein